MCEHIVGQHIGIAMVLAKLLGQEDRDPQGLKLSFQLGAIMFPSAVVKGKDERGEGPREGGMNERLYTSRSQGR